MSSQSRWHMRIVEDGTGEFMDLLRLYSNAESIDKKAFQKISQALGAVF